MCVVLHIINRRQAEKQLAEMASFSGGNEDMIVWNYAVSLFLSELSIEFFKRDGREVEQRKATFFEHLASRSFVIYWFWQP